MMIKQRKHNIRIKKKDNTPLIKVEESSIHNSKIQLEEVKLEEIPSLCAQSTPKRYDSNNSIKSQDGSDSPDYRTSFPLTQDENIEVTWDWHGSVRKDGNDSNKKSSDITTPKRATIKRRKRPPSSPLFYKPIRKQLIKRENTEGIEQFKAEMIALTNKLNHGQNYTEPNKINVNFSGVADTCVEIKFDNVNNEADTYDLINNKDSPLKTDNQPDNKSVDDLFNDSMDEVIIKFSQETEKKLNISPTGNTNNGNGKSLIENNPGPSSNYFVKLKSNGSANGVNIEKLNNNVSSKITSQSQQLLNKNQPSATSSSRLPTTFKKQTTVKADDVDLFIPDDSFDDFLVGCDNKETKNISKNKMSSSTVKPIGIQTHSNNKPTTSDTIKPSNEYLLKVPSTSTLRPASNLSKNNTSNINTLIQNPTKVQVGSGNINLATTSGSQIGAKKVTNVQPVATSTRTWKFFKSKSHSDSNFDSSESSTGTNVKQGASGTYDTSRANSSSSLKSGSNSNLGSKGSRVYGGKVVSNGRQTIQRAWTSSGLDSNVAKSFSNQKDNVNIYNVDRFRAEKGSGENKSGNEESQLQSGSITSSMQSMQLTRTPEEIERNRIEAMQKLEARKKRLQTGNTTIGSNSAITSSSISNTQRIRVER